jgi:hypothetical protein
VIEAPADLAACVVAQVLQVTTNTVQTDLHGVAKNAFTAPRPDCRLLDNACEGMLLPDLPALTPAAHSLYAPPIPHSLQLRAPQIVKNWSLNVDLVLALP